VKEEKSFHSPQNEALSTCKAVKTGKGGGSIAGVNFERLEKNWLYTRCNRFLSGTYFTKPVRGIEAPKKNLEKRLSGILQVEDRLAQMALKNRPEPYIEPVFYENSYGYCPDKSALNTIGTARQRCYKMKWVVEFDIVGLF